MARWFFEGSSDKESDELLLWLMVTGVAFYTIGMVSNIFAMIGAAIIVIAAILALLRFLWRILR